MKRELNLLKTENVEPNEIQNKYLKLDFIAQRLPR